MGRVYRLGIFWWSLDVHLWLWGQVLFYGSGVFEKNHHQIPMHLVVVYLDGQYLDDNGYKMYVMRGYTQLGRVVTMSVAKHRAREWSIIGETSCAMQFNLKISRAQTPLSRLFPFSTFDYNQSFHMLPLRWWKKQLYNNRPWLVLVTSS
jgi:hypothetical protein